MSETTVPNTPAEITRTARPNTAAELAAALRAGARDVHQAAAVDILLGLPGLLYTRPDVRSRYVARTHGEDGSVTSAGFLWTRLHDDLLTGMGIPVSPAERRMLMIACSIAAPANPVSLYDVLTGLDDACALLVVEAMRRIVRGHR